MWLECGCALCTGAHYTCQNMVHGFCGSHLSGEEQAPPRRKVIILSCGMLLPPPSGILFTLPYISFFFPFLFCFICFLSFLLSFLSFCILTLAEETATMQTKGWQRWAVRFPGIYFPVKTGASPSWDSHTNTLPVSYRPTIRALKTTTISLPGALPCWAEGNIILDILRLVAWGQEPTPTIFPEVWKTPETGNPGIPSTPNPPESLSETGGSMTSHWQ